MKEIRDLALLIVSTGIIAALLTVFFDWRGRLLDDIRGESHQPFTESAVSNKEYLS